MYSQNPSWKAVSYRHILQTKTISRRQNKAFPLLGVNMWLSVWKWIYRLLVLTYMKIHGAKWFALVNHKVRGGFQISGWFWVKLAFYNFFCWTILLTYLLHFNGFSHKFFFLHYFGLWQNWHGYFHILLGLTWAPLNNGFWKVSYT